MWYVNLLLLIVVPDSKVHVANIGPTRVLSAPGGTNVGHMNLAMWEYFRLCS